MSSVTRELRSRLRTIGAEASDPIDCEIHIEPMACGSQPQVLVNARQTNVKRNIGSQRLGAWNSRAPTHRGASTTSGRAGVFGSVSAECDAFCRHVSFARNAFRRSPSK